MRLVEGLVSAVEPPSVEHTERARERQAKLTKPPGSLGRLETMAARLAGIQRRNRPTTYGRRIVVFAGDHGVTEEGTSPYPSEVTGQMVENFVSEGAAINALARVAEAEVVVVDVGVRHPPEALRGKVELVRRSIRPGTRNLAREPAMTEDEMLEAIGVGVAEAHRAAKEGVALVGLGEMGIGNTTAASVLTAALTARPAEVVTGPGTGLDEAGVRLKIDVVERALALHRLSREEPLRSLQCVGGLEVAALVGLCLGAAAERLVVLVDGFITTAAFAVAGRLCPLVQEYAFFSHVSTEPGHRALLEHLGVGALFDLELRLGEGTGAALAMPLLGAAASAHNEMATFESAGISGKRG